jgi:hypothetical protein
MKNPVKPYLELKRAMLGAGLLSCSQAGFNIAMGALPSLQDGLSSLITRLFDAAEHWVVPPLIRADWIPAGAWDNPAAEQWVHAAPVGHVLTPQPAMHLLNRLRHHPAPGTYGLSGWCARQESDTLPLLRQVTFLMHERVHVELQAGAQLTGHSAFDRLYGAAMQLDLPVELAAPASSHRRCCRRPSAYYSRPIASRPSWKPRAGWGGDPTGGCGLERWCPAVIAGTAPTALNGHATCGRQDALMVARHRRSAQDKYCDHRINGAVHEPGQVRRRTGYKEQPPSHLGAVSSSTGASAGGPPVHAPWPRPHGPADLIDELQFQRQMPVNAIPLAAALARVIRCVGLHRGDELLVHVAQHFAHLAAFVVSLARHGLPMSFTRRRSRHRRRSSRQSLKLTRVEHHANAAGRLAPLAKM